MITMAVIIELRSCHKKGLIRGPCFEILQGPYTFCMKREWLIYLRFLSYYLFEIQIQHLQYPQNHCRFYT